MALSIKVYATFAGEEDSTFIFFAPNNLVDKVNPIQYGNFIASVNTQVNQKLINDSIKELFIKINNNNYEIGLVYDGMSYFDITPYINEAFNCYYKPSDIPKTLFIYPYIETSPGTLDQEQLVNKDVQIERIFIQYPIDTEHGTSLTKVFQKYFDYLTSHPAIKEADIPLNKLFVEVVISEYPKHEVQSITTPTQVFHLIDILDNFEPIFDFINEANLRSIAL